MASEAEIQALQRASQQIKLRLDRIEQQLALVSEKLSVPFAETSSTIPAEVLELVRAGKRLDAVTKYRALTNASAAEAQDVIAGI